MRKRDTLKLLLIFTATAAIAQDRRRGGGGPRPNDLGAAPLAIGEPGIAWYPKLEDGLAEAKRTNRPILFMAAASQCGGVPGVF